MSHFLQPGIQITYFPLIQTSVSLCMTFHPFLHKPKYMYCMTSTFTTTLVLHRLVTMRNLSFAQSTTVNKRKLINKQFFRPYQWMCCSHTDAPRPWHRVVTAQNVSTSKVIKSGTQSFLDHQNLQTVLYLKIHRPLSSPFRLLSRTPSRRVWRGSSSYQT